MTAAFAEAVGARFFCHLRPFGADAPVVVTNFPPSWKEAYASGRHHRADPVVAEGLKTTGMLSWSKDRLPSLADRMAVQALANRFDHGCEAGISFPSRGPNGQFSVLSLWYADEGDCRGRLQRHWCEMHTAALYLHRAAFAVDAPQVHPLSPVELECLKWTAIGKTAWEISVMLSLPERTVHYHISEAARKLGAPNKTGAACTAIRAGLLGD